MGIEARTGDFQETSVLSVSGENCRLVYRTLQPGESRKGFLGYEIPALVEGHIILDIPDAETPSTFLGIRSVPPVLKSLSDSPVGTEARPEHIEIQISQEGHARYLQFPTEIEGVGRIMSAHVFANRGVFDRVISDTRKRDAEV